MSDDHDHPTTADAPVATAEPPAHDTPAAGHFPADANGVAHAGLAAEPVPDDAPVPPPDDVGDEPPPADHAAELTAEAAPDELAAETAEEPEGDAEPAAEPERIGDEVAADGEPVAAGDPAETPAGEAEPAGVEPPPENPKKWYVVKVQSNREDSIKAAVERQIKIQNLEEFYGQIAIPVEEYFEKKKVSVKDKKTGQKLTEERNVTKRRKKYPGYLFAEVEFNDRILYVFRETSGVGDFVGATHHRAPNPMPDREVQQMLTGVIDPNNKDPKRKVKVKLDFEKGDKVRIRDGAFAGSEAEVKAISEPKDPTDAPKVTVVVTIWGRPVEMEMDSFHVDKA